MDWLECAHVVDTSIIAQLESDTTKLEQKIEILKNKTKEKVKSQHMGIELTQLKNALNLDMRSCGFNL